MKAFDHLRVWADELRLNDIQTGVLIGCYEDLTDEEIAVRLQVETYVVRAALKHLRNLLGASKKSELFFKCYNRLEEAGKRKWRPGGGNVCVICGHWWKEHDEDGQCPASDSDLIKAWREIRAVMERYAVYVHFDRCDEEVFIVREDRAELPLELEPGHDFNLFKSRDGMYIIARDAVEAFGLYSDLKKAAGETIDAADMQLVSDDEELTDQEDTRTARVWIRTYVCRGASYPIQLPIDQQRESLE